jgi:hypothetical protein
MQKYCSRNGTGGMDARSVVEQAPVAALGGYAQF